MHQGALTRAPSILSFIITMLQGLVCLELQPKAVVSTLVGLSPHLGEILHMSGMQEGRELNRHPVDRASPIGLRARLTQFGCLRAVGVG